MTEGLPIRQITIIRIITMAAGVLGALVMLLEDGFFALDPGRSPTLSAALVAMVGGLCLVNLARHVWTLKRLARNRPSSVG